MSEDTTSDPYTVRQGEAHDPPTNMMSRMKYLGPSLIVSGAVVGSGELILTSSLGAAAGFSLLWFIVLSCWSKSLVQVEVSRITITSGDTYLRAWNRIPGHFARLSWPIWIGLIGMVPGVMGLGGILSAGGLSMSFLSETINERLSWFPTIGITGASATIAIVTIGILAAGSYKWLERVMLALVLGFTLVTLICSIAMQFTDYGAPISEMVAGFKFTFPVDLQLAVLALSVYGYTGTTAGDISSYSYWCIEKGYPSFIGNDKEDPKWEERTRGWIKVLQTDVFLALFVLTCATIPYYILGAGVLNPMGVQPTGNDTIRALSNMFTQTLGGWAVWLFGFGAFFILFSTVLSAVGGGGRFIPDYLIEAKLFNRSELHIRKRWTMGYVVLMPIFAFCMYMWLKNPVLLIKIGGLTSAVTMPIQTGCTLWLQKHVMDQRIKPSNKVHTGLKVIFAFQCFMSALVLYFVFFLPFLKWMGWDELYDTFYSVFF